MDFRRLFDILSFQQSRYPQKHALSYSSGNKWQSFSTDDCLAEVNRVSAALLHLGFSRGDKIGLLFERSSPRWNFLDFGMQQIGVIVVPIHAAISASELSYILKDAEVKACIISTKELYQKVKSVADQLLHLKQLFCTEPLLDVLGWPALSLEPTDKHLEAFEGLKAAIHEDDLATIIYTSGASGNPKGVKLSHRNIVSNIKATITLVPVNCDKRVVSFLPLSHIFERMVIYCYLATGASVYYLVDAERTLVQIREIRPHYFTSVPRLLEKMYEGIVDRGQQMFKMEQKILTWAIHLGERYKGSESLSIGYFLKLKIADLLVYRRWRGLLGGRVEGVIVGAAALQPRLGRLFSAAGIEIREGYGLTETSPVIAFNRFEPGGVKFGTVGIPVPGIQLRIDDPNENGDGEIVVKGPGIMLGYHQKPALTEKVLDEEGWFRTGDVGRLVFKRFLQITDRKKDIFKTSSGKYVAPQFVERKLEESPYISQSMVIGFQRPFVTALLVPEWKKLQAWCKEHKVHWTAAEYMAHNTRVLQFYIQQITELNKTLNPPERVRHFCLLPQEWTTETGELTPTLKLRRSYILDKYAAQIKELYP